MAASRAIIVFLLASTVADAGPCGPWPHLTPAFRSGTAYGLRLWGIPAGSWAARVGLRNGDVVTHLAGCATLTRPQNVLDCYAKLETAARLDISLERRGVRLELSVEVHEDESLPAAAWSAQAGPGSVTPSTEPWWLAGVQLDEAPDRRAAVLVHRTTRRSITVREGATLGAGRVEHIAAGRVLVVSARGAEVVLPRPGAQAWVEQRKAPTP